MIRLFLIAAVIVVPVSHIGGQSSDRRPILPGELAQQVAQDEKFILNALGHFDDPQLLQAAIPQAERVLDIRVAEQGENWWETVDARQHLADLRLLLAMSAAQRATLAQAERLGLRSEELLRAGKHNQVAVNLWTIAEAERRFVGLDHPWYANTLTDMADLDSAQRRFAEAESLHRRALTIREKAEGPNHPDIATSLSSLAELCVSQGRPAESEPLYQRALAIRERALGPDNPEVAASLSSLAELYVTLGRYADAEPLLERALEIRERVSAADHPELATGLGDLAGVYVAQGRYADAEPLYQRALAIRERVLGPDDRDVATGLNDLAGLFVTQARYAEAEPLYLRALSIWEKALQPDDPDLAPGLSNLAWLYVIQGRYSEAAPLLQRAQRVLEAALPLISLPAAGLVPLRDRGRDTAMLAFVLRALAVLDDKLGQPTQAQRRLQRALEMEEKAFGPEHPAVAEDLSLLGSLYCDHRWYAEAEPLLRRALAIDEKTLGPEHVSVAGDLISLGRAGEGLGRKAEAERHFKRALAIYEKAMGPEHPTVATTAGYLGNVYCNEGRCAQAVPLLRRAITIARRTLGSANPTYAALLRDLGSALAAVNRGPEAAASLLSAAQAHWQNLTLNFPAMSGPQKKALLAGGCMESDLLVSEIFQGDGVDPKTGLQAALLCKHLLFEAARQDSRAMQQLLGAASPELRAAWLHRERLVRAHATVALQAALQAGRLEAPVAAVVKPQARGSVWRSVDPLTRQSEDLEWQIQNLDRTLRKQSQAYARETRLNQLSVDDLRGALRDGEALVEYLLYLPYDFRARTWGKERYAAFVLGGRTGEVSAINLGEAGAIDSALKAFQAEIYGFIDVFAATPSLRQVRKSEDQVAQASSAIRASVWQPLEAHLAGIRRVYLAADGQLSLIPFEALTRQDGAGKWRYLVEDREIVYVGTGRDLGRLALSQTTNRAKTAVLIGDPTFDAKPDQVAAVVAGFGPGASTVVADAKPAGGSATMGGSIAGGGRLRLDVPRPFRPVPEVEKLIRKARDKLESLGWSVITRTGQAAVEEEAENVHSPRILQFATHGYIMDRAPNAETSWDNPLLRSMLILAGADDAHLSEASYYRVGGALLTEAEAKRRGLSEEQLQAAHIGLGDGLLTAYEVTGMNLQGTDLVNLTACETGLGEVTPDGVAGLREAFLLAGARSLTVSMWQVRGDETAAQIGDFYDRWLGGSKPATRYEAFHAAQLAALARARRDHGSGHPFYWAGVVFVGDPGDLPVSHSR